MVGCVCIELYRCVAAGLLIDHGKYPLKGNQDRESDVTAKVHACEWSICAVCGQVDGGGQVYCWDVFVLSSLPAEYRRVVFPRHVGA
jgi:hypothetical protein